MYWSNVIIAPPKTVVFSQVRGDNSIGKSGEEGPEGLFQDAGFSKFLDGISVNWALKLWETGLDTPTVPGMS